MTPNRYLNPPTSLASRVFYARVRGCARLRYRALGENEGFADLLQNSLSAPLTICMGPLGSPDSPG